MFSCFLMNCMFSRTPMVALILMIKREGQFSTVPSGQNFLPKLKSGRNLPPLNSDAFTMWSRSSPYSHFANVSRATEFLLEEVLQQLAVGTAKLGCGSTKKKSPPHPEMPTKLAMSKKIWRSWKSRTIQNLSFKNCSEANCTVWIVPSPTSRGSYAPLTQGKPPYSSWMHMRLSQLQQLLCNYPYAHGHSHMCALTLQPAVCCWWSQQCCWDLSFLWQNNVPPAFIRRLCLIRSVSFWFQFGCWLGECGCCSVDISTTAPVMTFADHRADIVSVNVVRDSGQVRAMRLPRPGISARGIS